MIGLRLNGVAKRWPQAPVYARYHLQLGKMLDEKKFKGTSPHAYLRNVDVQWGRINVADLPQMDFSDEEREKYSLKRGDILICEGGECGRAAIWESDAEEYCFQKALHRLRPLSSESDDPRFFVWVMRAAVFDEVFTTFGTGSATIDHLPAERLRVFRYPCPSLADQRRIAAYLDSETRQMDALVAEKETMLKLLEEKRAAQISHAVTLGLDPRAPLKPSALPWLGDIPKHWEVRRAKYLFVQTSHPVEDDMEIVTCFRDGQVTLRKNRRAEGYTNAILELGYQSVKAGQLVLHSMDAFAGAIGVSDSDGKCSPEYINCDAIDPGVDNWFYAVLLRQMALRGFIQAACPAVRERAPRIRFSNFAEMFLPVPPLEEQRAIVAHLAAERERTAGLEAALRESIHLLQERRRALITAAVTGQIAI